MRKIIHLDMDCFYAAVEMRDRPELAGHPVAVGGGSRRGVICTCNYEARAFGVRSAMPGFKARELCPDLVFLPVRFPAYQKESDVIREILKSYTHLVEPLSLDEAYLDVTGHSRYAWDLAREIRARILEATGLTASAGIAPNKMLAKIASDWRKPNGQFAVTPDQIDEFMTGLPVRKVWGVGPKAESKLASMGVGTCGDLQGIPLPDLLRHFGSWGGELFHLCRGIDDREVLPDRIRKSRGTERTFADLLQSHDSCEAALRPIVDELLSDLQAHQSTRPVRKAVVKVKFADFTQTTRECPCVSPEWDVFRMLLFQALPRSDRAVRLLGAGVQFGATEPNPQTVFEFDDPLSTGDGKSATA